MWSGAVRSIPNLAVPCVHSRHLENSMSRTPFAILATVVAAGVSAASPALAQQGQSSAAPLGRAETVPFQLSAERIEQMQSKLNQLGFSAGHVDGIWGPDTSAAVLRFQQSNSLQATGKLDDGTLRALGLVGSTAASPATAAQAVPPQPTPAPVTPVPATPVPATPVQSAPASGTPPVAADGHAVDNALGTSTTPGSPPLASGLSAPPSTSGAAAQTSPGGNAGKATGDGSNNQAVATSSANAPQPAHGANSFTKGQAQARITREGFQNVGDLSNDNAGVWRGKATKNGQPVHVWLDYKGNVGQD